MTVTDRVESDMRAVFVSTSNAFSGRVGTPKGGVQICTSEYLTVLRAAGFGISIIEFMPDQRIQTRVKRRLRPMPYRGLIPPLLAIKVVDEIKRTGAQVVFLNMVDLAPLAKILRQATCATFKIILLSHGLHSTDLLHNVRIKLSTIGLVTAKRRDLLWLASHLATESEQRKFIDYVFCLSEFEVGLERWIGSQRVSWLPRILETRPLPWQPTPGRFGFVGTLDHPPNWEGLHLFLKELAKQGERARVRVIGGPVEVGRRLAANYSTVDYLGHLDDEQLVQEAATWASAVHPLFCNARGCSTKLATYLAWQIPVVTTPQGCRGYVWTEGHIPQANDPKSLVDLVLKMNIPETAAAVRVELAKVVANSPTLEHVAQLVKRNLADLCRLI